MNFGTVERQIECLSVSDFGVCGDTYRKSAQSNFGTVERQIECCVVGDFGTSGATYRKVMVRSLVPVP